MANSERKLENGSMGACLHLYLPRSCYGNPSLAKYLRNENISSDEEGRM